MVFLADLMPVLLYAGQNIAMFGGGLFAGAAIYVSLTECPPRTTLGLSELISLAHAIAGRSARLLLVLSVTTATSAVVAAIAGAGGAWLGGGLVHLALSIFLLTGVQRTVRDLEQLHPDSDRNQLGEKLMRQRAGQFGLLGLGGMAALYLFIIA